LAGAATFRFGWIPLAALVAALTVWWWCLRVSPVVVLAAATLCIVPPGVLGESSVWLSLATFAATILAILRAQKDVRVAHPVIVILLLIEGGVFAALGGSKSYLAVGVLYVAAALLLRELTLRPILTQRVLAATFTLVAIECVSAVGSYLTGFHRLAGLNLKYRHVVLYAPLTFASEKVNTGGWWAGKPRFTAFAGEPGLAAVLLLLGFAYFLIFERGARRVFLVAVLLAGCVLTQSTGLVFALIAFGVVASTLIVALRLTPLPALLFACTTVPVLIVVTDRLLAAKARANPLSVSQRGLFGSAFEGDISILATLHHHAQLVLPLLAIVAYLLWLSHRQPVAAGLVASISVLGFYVEPLQYHPATWILVALVVMLSRRNPGALMAMRMNGSECATHPASSNLSSEYPSSPSRTASSSRSS
jgi:hypothetical protein